MPIIFVPGAAWASRHAFRGRVRPRLGPGCLTLIVVIFALLLVATIIWALRRGGI